MFLYEAFYITKLTYTMLPTKYPTYQKSQTKKYVNEVFELLGTLLIIKK